VQTKINLIHKDTITTKQWSDAGLPFEGWLRYTQLPNDAKRRLEARFVRNLCRCGHIPHDAQCPAPDGCWCDTVKPEGS